MLPLESATTGRKPVFAGRILRAALFSIAAVTVSAEPPPFSEPIALPQGCNVQNGRRCKLADGTMHPAVTLAKARNVARTARPHSAAPAAGLEETGGTANAAFNLDGTPLHPSGRPRSSRRCLSLLPPGFLHDPALARRLCLLPTNITTDKITYSSSSAPSSPAGCVNALPLIASLERKSPHGGTPGSDGKPYVFNAVLPMHIPKTAGYSLRSELSKRFGLETGHMEEYLSEFEARWPGKGPNGGRPIFTLVRSPRAHVYSQYLECRYDDWGVNVTSYTSFPAKGLTNEEGFRLWLAHFLTAAAGSSDGAGRSSDGGAISNQGRSDADLNPAAAAAATTVVDGEAGAFKCYSPWNMQTRYLTAKRPTFMAGQPRFAFGAYLPAHFTYSSDDRGDQVSTTASSGLGGGGPVLNSGGPSGGLSGGAGTRGHSHEGHSAAARKALAKLQGLAWFGATELFHESLCLLEVRLTGKLPPSCICSDKGTATAASTAAEAGEAHESHHVPKHSVADISTSTLAMVDRLTRSDSALYSHALALLIHRIHAAEAATGATILCGDKRDRALREVAYLPGAVAALTCADVHE